MKTEFKTDLSLLPENIKKKIEEYLPDENVKLIKIKNNEYSIIKNNLRLYSIYKPTEEVNKFIKTINIEEKNIVILLGFGLGYHFQKIFNSFKFKKIFIIEYNYDVLYFAFQLFDYSSYLRKENVYFVDTTNDTNFLDFLADNISLDELDKIKIIKIDSIIKSEREKFINALVLITKLYNFKIINFGTIVKFSREWQNNTLRNLLNLNNTNNISNLKNIFNNKPILIVCAGPSLENKIEYIKKLKSHIIIAAVDTATKVLLDNDIKPDIIAVVDSQAINYSLIKDLDLSDIYLLINLIVPPEIYKKHSPEKIIIYNSNTPVLDWFEKNFNIKIGYLKSGGSVSTILFSFAIFTGCNPIIFVGQDLSFPEMKIYSQGTKKEELYLSALNKFITYETFIYNNYFHNENIITEKDIYNNSILTNNVLKGYRDWLVYESKNYPEREFINASESGILNETFKLKKISEIYEKYKNNFVNTDDVLKDNYYPITISNFQLINLFADLSNEFNKLKENTSIILELLKASSGLTQTLSIELNNYFSFYNSLKIKNFIDYNIQNYLLNFNINDLELCKKLFEQIKTESENFIQILKQIT